MVANAGAVPPPTAPPCPPHNHPSSHSPPHYLAPESCPGGTHSCGPLGVCCSLASSQPNCSPGPPVQWAPGPGPAVFYLMWGYKPPLAVEPLQKFSPDGGWRMVWLPSRWQPIAPTGYSAGTLQYSTCKVRPSIAWSQRSMLRRLLICNASSNWLVILALAWFYLRTTLWCTPMLVTAPVVTSWTLPWFASLCYATTSLHGSLDLYRLATLPTGAAHCTPWAWRGGPMHQALTTDPHGVGGTLPADGPSRPGSCQPAVLPLPTSYPTAASQVPTTSST